ncbi:MAG TPA: hypothetical protein VK427_10345, partial [Kofleriaceae bacterium]|nr:hypothetical protein [Kofleriaceae bacterium]
MLQEAVEEHLAIKRILADMMTMQLDDDQFNAKLHVLKEQVVHHAHKEEEEELFPKVRDLMTADERAGIGNEVLVMFEGLMEASPNENLAAETAEAAPLPSPASQR